MGKSMLKMKTIKIYIISPLKMKDVVPFKAKQKKYTGTLVK